MAFRPFRRAPAVFEGNISPLLQLLPIIPSGAVLWQYCRFFP
jgi:hypothetical protein